MKILIVHNRYLQRGGEDTVFENEVKLLRDFGQDVETLVVDNESINGTVSKIKTAIQVAYNSDSERLMRRRLNDYKPDIVHVHNFFPMLSPSIFNACRKTGVPVVLTLHNFRITCANGLLLRSGNVCDKCVGRLPLPAIIHKCYRDSTAGSAALAVMIGYHKAIGTWKNKVSRFIALNSFAKSVFVKAGVPEEIISIKPNCIPDPISYTTKAPPRRGYVYVGRLSEEKGIATLLEAWTGLDVPLSIAGAGPLEKTVLEASKLNPAITYVGQLDRKQLFELLSSSVALIVPSIWYENFPMTVVEAMAVCTPVIASRLGSLKEIVTDGFNGLHFDPGDPHSLRRLIQENLSNNNYFEQLGFNARSTYLRDMTAEATVIKLQDIYNSCIDERKVQTKYYSSID